MTVLEFHRSKLSVAKSLLSAYSKMWCLVNTKHPETDVPPKHAGNGLIYLQIGLDMPIPIPDLHLSDYGWSGTLSFEKRPYQVFIPWEAVVSMGEYATNRAHTWVMDRYQIITVSGEPKLGSQGSQIPLTSNIAPVINLADRRRK